MALRGRTFRFDPFFSPIVVHSRALVVPAHVSYNSQMPYSQLSRESSERALQAICRPRHRFCMKCKGSPYRCRRKNASSHLYCGADLSGGAIHDRQQGPWFPSQVELTRSKVACFVSYKARMLCLIYIISSIAFSSIIAHLGFGFGFRSCSQSTLESCSDVCDLAIVCACSLTTRGPESPPGCYDLVMLDGRSHGVANQGRLSQKPMLALLDR